MKIRSILKYEYHKHIRNFQYNLYVFYFVSRSLVLETRTIKELAQLLLLHFLINNVV